MTIRFPAGGIGWVWLAVSAAVSLGAPSPASAQDRSDARKMLKQIGVMEQILDQVLIDSPNFLVPGRGNARGIYLGEFGVLLTFEASLVEKDWDDWGDWGNSFKVETDEKGNRVIIIPDPEDGDEEGRKEIRDRGRQRAPSEERLYTAGKLEIEDLLLDYAGTLTALRDEHSVAVAAFLKDSDYFLDQRISRLIIRAKMKDVREWDAGRIDEKEMRARLVEEEY
jgi:hypothetical protein